MVPSCARPLHGGLGRQQRLLELEGRQGREEASDLHVEQVGRAGYARRTVLRCGGDDQLLTTLPAEGDEGRPLAIEEGGVEAVPLREELLRLREYLRGGERGAELLERALGLVHDGAVSGRVVPGSGREKRDAARARILTEREGERGVREPLWFPVLQR